MKMHKLTVKRIEPLDGNTFTADWANNTRGDYQDLDKADTRPSTVANFDIELTFEEATAVYNGYLAILDDMLKARLGIDLKLYNIVEINEIK